MKQLNKMTLEQLQRIYKESWAEIQERELTKREKQLKQFIGKCFKYKNSFSCPCSETDYWWSYMRVKTIENGVLVCLTFQKDKEGKITIDQNYIISNLCDNYILCSRGEFDLEFEKIMVELSDIQYGR